MVQVIDPGGGWKSPRPYSEDEFIRRVEQLLGLPADAKLAAAKEPPHPWQTKLLDNVSGETISQTVENLKNWDDLMMAQTSNGAMRIAPSNGCFQAMCIPRLARVRRLLAAPAGEVVPLLRKKLAQAIDGAEAACEAFAKEYAAKAPNMTISEPVTGNEWGARQTYAAATVYLLTAHKDYKSLPLMNKAYKGMNPRILVSVVPRDYLVYAMFQLARTYPRAGLTDAQIKKLDDCLEAGKDLRLPTESEVTVWNDPHPEHDLRYVTTLENPHLELRPATLKMPAWNLEFKDGEQTAVNNIPAGRVSTLAARLDTFVEAISQQE
jgi:hypothetical protein